MLAARPARIEPLYKHFRGIISVQILRAMGSIALVATLLVWWCAVLTNTASADDCLAEPNSPAPAGSHWYYHLDRAQASASDPISPGNSAPSLPRVEVPAVKPQRASVSGAARDQSAQQGAQEAISIQAPAPQASQSSQTSDQGATTRSVPAPPDPPIATFKAQERTAPPSDSPTEFIQPTADTTAGTSVPDDAKSTARDGGSTANAAGTAASVTPRPWKLEIRM
jgi:hypothetical protein